MSATGAAHGSAPLHRQPFSRRSLLKFGALGTIGVAGLAAPLGRSVSTASASSLASRNFPGRFATPFVRPPLLAGEVRYDDQGPYRFYSVTEKRGYANI